MSADDSFVSMVLRSRSYDVCVETPLDYLASTSARFQSRIYGKREDLQPVFCHKLRGAYNQLWHISKTLKNDKLITAGNSNFVISCALSSRQLNKKLTVVFPVNTPPEIVDRVRMFGTEIILYGNNLSHAYNFALELAKRNQQIFIPQSSIHSCAGYGEIANELIRQHRDLRAVFVPIGDGTTLIAIAHFLNRVAPEVQVIGVKLFGNDVFAKDGALWRNPESEFEIPLSEGSHYGFTDDVSNLAKKTPISTITVTDSDIFASMIDIMEDTRTLVEPNGAMALAGAKKTLTEGHLKDCEVAVIITGANGSRLSSEFLAKAYRDKKSSPLRRVFVSYSRANLDYVKPIINELKKTYEIWVDFLSLKGGERWEETIQREISSRDKVLVFLSQKATHARGYFNKELKLISRTAELFPDNRIFVVPILIDPCEIPISLQQFHGINMYDRTRVQFISDLKDSLNAS